MTTIGVIVPIYNAEDTLERCVGSILAQTHAELNVVLIDDGSTDISGAICDAYAEFESRVQALHTPNRGLSAARNLGVDHALAAGVELVAFVDADDWLEPHMLEKLLAALDASEADIAQCGWRTEGFRTTNDSVLPEAVYSRNEALYSLICGGISTVVWNKLYCSRVLAGTRFPDGRVYEDCATTYRIIASCDKVVSIPYIGYHHVMRKGSICHTPSMKNLSDSWSACKERYDYYHAEESDLIDADMADALARSASGCISAMWRWAFCNSRSERAKYSYVLQDMQHFERQELRFFDKRRWPAKLTIPLALSRSRSSLSLAVGYYINQLFITLFPKKSSSRR